jgi:hypothetical protein
VQNPNKFMSEPKTLLRVYVRSPSATAQQRARNRVWERGKTPIDYQTYGMTFSQPHEMVRVIMGFDADKIDQAPQG